MKDYRRAGMTAEQLEAALRTHAKDASMPVHGRLGCVSCGVETARFFVYTDMLVCIKCQNRFALYNRILPELTHLSTRLVCHKCRGFHWWAGKTALYCKCGATRVTATEIRPVPLFDYFELPEPVGFGADAKAEIRKLGTKCFTGEDHAHG